MWAAAGRLSTPAVHLRAQDDKASGVVQIAESAGLRVSALYRFHPGDDSGIFNDIRVVLTAIRRGFEILKIEIAVANDGGLCSTTDSWRGFACRETVLRCVATTHIHTI
jgi:hypothetical protein